MGDSDCDSDQFLSADEFDSGDKEDSSSIINLNNKNNNVVSANSNADVSTSARNSIDSEPREESRTALRTEESTNRDDEIDARSYRKRPERLKSSVNKDKNSKTVDFIQAIDLTKVARTDVLTDFTQQFTSKISKGLASFQEKSSSLKGFVKENLVSDINKAEEVRFVYDDDRTKDSSSEDPNSSTLLEDVPKSNINDEILKLSNAFAKLNEKMQTSMEDSQGSAKISNKDIPDNIIDDVTTNIQLTVEASKNICSPQSESNNAILPHINSMIPLKNDSPITLDESCEDVLLSSINVPPIIEYENTSIKVNFENLQETVTAIDDLNTDGWEEMICSEDEGSGEENTESKDKVKLEIDLNVLTIAESEGKAISQVKTTLDKPETTEDNDGWDDWKMSDDEDIPEDKTESKIESHPDTCVEDGSPKTKPQPDDEEDGWGDWGDDEFTDIQKQEEPIKPKCSEIRPLGSQGNVSKPKEWSGWDSFGQKKEKEWGLGGWGINTLLSTATAVTSNLSAAIESGLGVPDPETMARMSVEEEKQLKIKKNVEKEECVTEVNQGQFPFQHLVAGVGKIVEVANVQKIGSRVLSGGLDTLESIGKKTMEVLQEGDPGLKKKRALISEHGQKLSNALKEARDKAMEEDHQSKEMKIERRYHFETLFDDFQGLVHLEALEMLSRQCELRLEQIQLSLPADRQKELQETLEEVKELCEVDEDFDNVEIDNFEEAITEVVSPLKNELSSYKIIEVHKRLSEWLESENISDTESNQLYDKAISTIAELTAAVTMQFHKSGELLILKERRKTVEEADCLMQLSSHLCYEIKAITKNLEDQLSTRQDGNIRTLIRNLKAESENAVGYIKQAFMLLIPVIQLGAA